MPTVGAGAVGAVSAAQAAKMMILLTQMAKRLILI
jgi:formiminotetrahydrofolate cyclodeaminase